MKSVLGAVALLVTCSVSAATTFDSCEVQKHSCIREPFCAARLSLSCGHHQKIFTFFEGVEGPGTLDAWKVHVPGVPKQFLLAVATSAGGSDVTFEASVIGVVDHEASEVSPRLIATSQDALCIGRFAGQPGALVMNFSWTDEAHYAPHFYTATLYRWDGSALVETKKIATKVKHPSWRSAAHELGFRCETNFVEKALADR